MIKKPAIMPLILCTSFLCHSISNATDDLIVVDSREEDGNEIIRFLTPQGVAKATSLQEFYEQSMEKESNPLVELTQSSEYDKELECAAALSREESDIAKAIDLSLEESRSGVNLLKDLNGITSQTLKLSHPKEDDDLLFKQALLVSAQEHEVQQKIIYEEIRSRKDREEESKIYAIEQQSLLSERKSKETPREEKLTIYSAPELRDSEGFHLGSSIIFAEQEFGSPLSLRETTVLKTTPNIVSFSPSEDDHLNNGKIGEDQFFEDPKNPYQMNILREDGDQIWAKIKVINSSNPDKYVARRLPCPSSFIRWVYYDNGGSQPYNREEVRVEIKCGTRSFQTIYKKQEKHY